MRFTEKKMGPFDSLDESGFLPKNTHID